MKLYSVGYNTRLQIGIQMNRFPVSQEEKKIHLRANTIAPGVSGE